jgi:hypothetical protein
MPWELPIHVARGRLQFLSTERRFAGAFRPGEPVDDVTFKLWSRLLGAGFRLPLAGASDYPCVTRALEARTLRTDVIVDAPRVTYDAWLDGLRNGRVAVGDGVPDRLHLRVSGVGVGGEAHAAAGATLPVWVESVFAQEAEVQVLANGQRVGSARVPAGRQATRLEIVLPRSAWVVAVSPHVMTSPVYVLVENRPIRVADDACYLLRYVDHLKTLVAERRLDLAGDAPAAVAAYDEARETLRARFREAGGETCR